jgi:hypothetical protein
LTYLYIDMYTYIYIYVDAKANGETATMLGPWQIESVYLRYIHARCRSGQQQ